MDIEGPEDCDLLVIGASLTGAAAARDASGRGLKVCLIEQGDLGAAAPPATLALPTGSRATREEQAELGTLRAMAPHVVRPVRLFTPQTGDDTNLAVRLLTPLHRAELRPAPHDGFLQTGTPRGTEHSDGLCDEARLVVLTCCDAHERGAAIHPRTPLVGLRRRSDCWQAQVRRREGLHIINARMVINAAGPAADAVLALAFPGRAPGTLPTPTLLQDSYAVVERLFPGEQAFGLPQPDGTCLLVLPYAERFSLLARCGLAADADGDAAIWAAARRVLKVPVGPAQALARFSRLRASPADSPFLDTGNDDTAPALLTLAPGPVATARLRAERALDRLGAGGPRWTAREPLLGGNIDWLRFDAFIADQQRRAPWLDPAVTRRLARTYGTGMARILAGAQQAGDLGAHMGGGLYAAELAYLVQHEFARTPDDVLQRRTGLGLVLDAAAKARAADWFARLALRG